MTDAHGFFQAGEIFHRNGGNAMYPDMSQLMAIQGLGARPDVLFKALQMGGAGAAGGMSPTIPMTSDKLAFSQDLSEGQGQAFNHPLLGGPGSGIGVNSGMGSVPGFGGMKPGAAAGGSQQMVMMQMMMMMMQMMMKMMQGNGFMGQNMNSASPYSGGFGNPVNMRGNFNQSQLGGMDPATVSAFSPNRYMSPNPMVNTPNMLGMINGGTMGLNGMNMGQNNWNGGGQVYNPAYQFDNLMSGFRQSTEGNCSSVATIKAAMDKYGTGVFADMQKSQDGGYNLLMKDGVGVNISPQELQMAQQQSAFKGEGGQEQSYGTLCYAAMAKRAMMEGYEGAGDFQSACGALNNGEWPQDTARLLGLQNNMMSVDPGAINGNMDSLVGWSGQHTVFMDNVGGQLYADNYGQANLFDGTDTKGHGLEGAFMFV